jgi:signal transduction histidine kinase
MSTVPSVSAQSRVRVVDDITKNLQVVGSMLRNEGYHVMPATSGAQALERARARLREMKDEKNEFMGIAAHDLRSPLGGIKSYAEMILEEPGMDRVELDRLVAGIRDAAARMAGMVQNLLDANRIERGEMRLELAPVELHALAADVVQTQQPRAAAKQQSLRLESEPPPLSVLADPGLMVQVLENLVSNAVKYSPPNKPIVVRVTRLPRAVRCAVVDEGPGLSADDQKKLFGKFARLSAKPTGGEHATGLGLSIMKKMVEAMSGKVWCESEPGQGATLFRRAPDARVGASSGVTRGSERMESRLFLSDLLAGHEPGNIRLALL